MDFPNLPPRKYSEQDLLAKIKSREIEVFLESDFSRYLPEKTRNELIRMINEGKFYSC